MQEKLENKVSPREDVKKKFPRILIKENSDFV